MTRLDPLSRVSFYLRRAELFPDKRKEYLDLAHKLLYKIRRKVKGY
jgi:hypothetical protein